MESKIPLPTDNIYKFYAMFGILLLITSILGIIWVSSDANEKLHTLAKEYEDIPGNYSEKDKTAISKIIKDHAQFKKDITLISVFGLGLTTSFSLMFIGYGFRQWHTKIQPKQDEYFELQLKKLRNEVKNQK